MSYRRYGFHGRADIPTDLEDTAMLIGVTSQNFRTITGHAGKARRFIVYRTDAGEALSEVERLDLPKSMSLHEYHGDEHPLFALDVLVTAGCGDNFRQRLTSRGLKVITTSETDPATAVSAIANGQSLPPALPHDD
ncbi:NifB/NifX family molybdenum-iron cluster-binding protein [Thiosocius teredinicola]|uniref:NifB/NifX family molybdenum-iron cluster-binding protein n=1 Tax=Thiosocius teredinicola TaxID=1973002 RepID=UPI002FE4E4FE